MGSLARLEMALLENDSQKVSDFICEIDRKTANEAMRQAGEAFGFPTILANGVVWSHMGMLSHIFGYSTVSGVLYLTDKYQLMTSKIGWFTVELKTRAREIFKLSEKDSQAVFVTWDTFLVLGMCGRGDKAEKVKLYLLQAERAFRIGMAKDAGLSVAKADLARLRLVKEEIGMMNMIDRMKDGHFKLAAIEAFENISGNKYPEPKQMVLNFIKKDGK